MRRSMCAYDAKVLCDKWNVGKKIGRNKYRNLFFFNDTATTEIYTLSLHDALPISVQELKVPMVPYLEMGGSNFFCLGTEGSNG